MKLRLKILSGFLLLVAMLIVAGGLSIIEFSKISRSVRDLLDDNYQSIQASQSMLEALEREDSGVLLLVHGNWNQGRNTIARADSVFQSNLRKARHNITETNERPLIDSIIKQYGRFNRIWEKPIAGTFKEENLTWYYQTSHQAFSTVKHSVNQLMSLNQKSMYQEATDLREKAKRAIMPGIVAILSAFIFSFLFNFFINHYLISPLERLIGQLENFRPDSLRLEAGIKTRDELKRLQDAINDLISRIKFSK